MPAPIALFVYNRPWHTARTVEALSRNNLAEESDLIIFSDGVKNEKTKSQIDEVRAYIRGIKGFKSVKIFESEKNKGLAQSIIDGVSLVLTEYEEIIVLEDDLVTSVHFLDFMNQALTLYEREEKVISIHGYVYPVKESLPDTFFLRGSDCWGWATWKRGWALFQSDGTKLLNGLKQQRLLNEFDFENSYSYSKMLSDQIAGKNDSWAVRWYASSFLENRLTLYPGISFVRNIGHDSSGTHSGSVRDFDVSLNTEPVKLLKLPLWEDSLARKVIANYLKGVENSITNKTVRKIKGLIKLI